MMFSWIPIEAAMKIPTIRNSFIRCIYLITSECNLPTNQKFILEVLGGKLTLKKDVEFELKKSGLYLLHDSKTSYAMALVSFGKLEGIYVPLEHRRSGYATELLKNIYKLYKDIQEIPICSPVKSDIVPAFTKAGWVKYSDKMNKDGTFNYVPDYSFETLKSKDHSGTCVADVTGYMRAHLMPMLNGLKFMK
jgi:hypothetical protein